MKHPIRRAPKEDPTSIVAGMLSFACGEERNNAENKELCWVENICACVSVRLVHVPETDVGPSLK